MRFKNKRDNDKLICVRHLDDGANTDQYLRRKDIVQLSEQPLLPFELSKATHGYTNTDTGYYIPTGIKKAIWHAHAFTRWYTDKGDRHP